VEAISPYFRLPEEGEPKPATESRFPAVKVAAGFVGLLALIVITLVWVQHLIAAPTPQAAISPPLAPVAPVPTADAAAAQAAAVADTPEAPVTATSSEAAAKPPVDVAAQLESNRAAAVEMLRAQLPQTNGAQFRNVKTNLSSDNGEMLIDFCGEVNVVNPTGAYVGFQRFVSSKRAAKIEEGAAPGDFEEVWQVHCTGAEGPRIWR